MSDSSVTKICPACAEAIKAAAKVCPHCRHPQKWWSLQNPQAAAGLWIALWMLVCFAALIAMGVFFERMFGPKRNFSEYPDQIAVVESKFSHRMSGTNLMVTVVGVLTNQGDFAWKDIGLESQFFDKQGGLIDVVSRAGGGITLAPRSDGGKSKARLRALSPTTLRIASLCVGPKMSMLGRK